MASLSIIIPTKDRGEIFLKTLQSIISASSSSDTEIIVVNNSLTPIQLANKPNNVSVYDNPYDKNSVFSSRNYGASLARNQVLLFIDDDIIVSKESIVYALRFHDENSNACFNVNWQYPPELLAEMEKNIFGKFLMKTGFTTMRSLYGEGWKDNAPFIARSLASFFFCIKKDDFMKIGGYNEKHLHEGTDIDITDKLIENKITIWINPLIMVYHNEADRIDLMNWLQRKKRFGVISRNAVNMGDSSHALHYTGIKVLAFRMIYMFQPLLLQLLAILNKLKANELGFKVIDALLGANICVGYNSTK
jgi:glycosyltransferase involved in cell wall biosynthesis